LGARPTLLDVAKDAIEKFLKLRQRDPASRLDRYMLLTFEDPPSNIKAGWKEHHTVFMNELKNLTASGMTTLGSSLKHAFDLLNLNRMQTGIDTYGQGRCPFYLEPSIIIVITDGGKLSSPSGVQEDLTLPMHSSVPGSELTKEPFRWDQRLFSLVLRLTGTVPNENGNNNANLIVPDPSPIDDMCEVTGGCSYSVTSQRALMACLENVVSKIQGGVVIHFDRVGTDPVTYPGNKLDDEDSRGGAGDDASNSSSSMSIPADLEAKNQGWSSCRRLIYVQRSAVKGYSVGHWPLPESYWPDGNSPSLPPRTAHPVVKFTTADAIPMVIENLPFDKYELEPCALTRVILSRKSPNTAWQCYISNSHRSGDLGYPFGYLKASTTMNCVNLFVLPYNYPILLPLLDDLVKIHGMKPPRDWKAAWDNYIKTVPPYYATPLKRALQRMGAPPSLVPDSMENYLSYSVLNQLKRLKNQAKAEFDKLVSSVGSYASKVSTAPDSIKLNTAPSVQGSSSSSSGVTGTGRKLLDLVMVGNINHSRVSSLQKELTDFPNFLLRVKEKGVDLRTQSYRNPFDIPRRDLIDQIHRMRVNFFLPPEQIRFQDEDQLHSLPVAQMGNYQDYLKRMATPLRELESTPVRQHMFGNPFKIDKKGLQGIVDETDIDLVGNGGNGNGNVGLTGSTTPTRGKKSPANNCGDVPLQNRKPVRRPGPLPKDFSMSPRSPTPSTSSSRPSSPPVAPSSTNLSVDSDVVMESFQDLLVDDDTLAQMESIPSAASTITSLTPVTSDDDVEMLDTTERPATATPPAKVTKANKTKHNTKSPTATTTSFLSFTTTTPPSTLSSISDVNVNSMFTSTAGSEPFVPEEKESRLNGQRSQPNYNNNSTAGKGIGLLLNGLDGDFSKSNNNNKRYLNGGLYRPMLTPEEGKMRRQLFSLVKRPGRNFSELLIQLESIAPQPFKEFLIKEVIQEATRFKRKYLISLLEDKFPSQVSRTS